MPRTTLTPTAVGPGGTAVTPAAANVDGHSVRYHPALDVTVVNGSGAPIDVTIPTPRTVDGLAIADQVGAVAAGATRRFSGFKPVHQQADGSVHLDFSAVTTVTVVATHPAS
jgi:hypothetical protein